MKVDNGVPLVDEGGRILCFACRDIGDPHYYNCITGVHLTRKHPDRFNDIHTAVGIYKELYPDAPIVSEKQRKGLFDRDKKKKTVADYLREFEEAVDEAGSLVEWAQNESGAIYMKLLELEQQEREPAVLVAIAKEKRSILREFQPSRNKRDARERAKTASKKDVEALNKMDELMGKFEGELNQMDESVMEYLNQKG